MPVNFGLLSAIPAPQIIGSVPGSAPNNSADSLMGGIMQGIQQGQQIQMNKQTMDQQAQLFPIQKANAEAVLQGNKNTAESSNIDLNNKKLDQKALDAYKGMVDQGREAQIKAMATISPVAAIKMQQDLSVMDKNMADAASAIAESRPKQIAALHEIQINGGDAAHTAVGMATTTAVNPQTGKEESQIDWAKADAAYQQILAPLVKDSPELRKLYPEHLDQASAANLQYIGQSAMYNKITYELGKQAKTEGGTNDTKNAAELARLKGLVDSGKATQADKDTYNALQGLTKKSESESQTKKLQDEIAAETDPARKAELQKALDKESSKGLISDTVGAITNFLGVGADNIKKAGQQVGKTYTLQGQPFDMEAAKKATGLSEEEIIKQAGLK